MCFSSLYDDEPNATISASSLRIVFELLSGQRLNHNPDIKISGDEHLALQVQSILRQVEIDWEEPLSQLTGDILAHEVGNFARSAKKWFLGRSSNFKEDLKDYIKEEQNEAVFRNSIKQFSHCLLREPDFHRLTQRKFISWEQIISTEMQYRRCRQKKRFQSY